MSKQRFYIGTQGNDDKAYKEAMEYACKLAKSDSDIRRIVLLIHSKQNTGWFERLFGPDIEQQLFRGVSFKECEPVFKFETKRTYKDSHIPSEIVITCSLDADEISKIDDFFSIKVIIAIPWNQSELQKWVSTWGPTEIRGNQQAVTVYSEPSCIIKKSMQELTESINISTGITHPLDEKKAKTFILALYKYEPSLNADIVGTYLVRELNWKTIHAKTIENLINTLNSGKHFQGGQRTGLQDFYKRWKKECDR